MAKHVNKWKGHVSKWRGHVSKWKGHVRKWKGHVRKWKGHVGKWTKGWQKSGDEVSTVTALYHEVPINKQTNNKIDKVYICVFI